MHISCSSAAKVQSRQKSRLDTGVPGKTFFLHSTQYAAFAKMFRPAFNKTANA
jgi:hypothetical protein